MEDEPIIQEYTGPEYWDFYTDNGTIRLVYELSLGDMLIGTLLCLILLFAIIRAVFNALWR